MEVEIFKWNDQLVREFVRVTCGGQYGDYKGCKTVEQKLTRFKELKSKEGFTGDVITEIKIIGKIVSIYDKSDT